MVKRYCVICERNFMTEGNTRTCSMQCAYEQKRRRDKEYKRKSKLKKYKNKLLETQQKAEAAGMSYGKYMAVMHGGMAIERGECDGKID